ncbi:gamma-aminobutyric acid receptor subunit pi-like [Haemaphysalis longicornis]
MLHLAVMTVITFPEVFRLFASANLTVDEAITKLVVLGSSYKKYVAPSQAGEPAQVYVDINLMNVDPPSGSESEFGLLALVRLSWRDRRLNLTFFSKNNFLALPAYLEEEIWSPRLAFLDAHKVDLLPATDGDHASSRITNVFEDGTLAATRRYVFKASCVINLELYPLGIQHCPFRIKLRRHTEASVQLHWAVAPQTGVRASPRLHTVTVTRTDQALHSIAGHERCLLLMFAFSRNPWPHILSTWLPSALLVPVAWARLWFPGSGLFLPCAALAGLALHATEFKELLRGHDVLTAMDAWLLLCLLLVLAAFLDHLQATAGSTRQRAWSAQTPPVEAVSAGQVERLYVADGFRLTRDVATQTPPDVGMDEALYDRRARLAFAVGFPFVALVYWTSYLAASR